MIKMRTVKIKKADIKVPNTTAFQHSTPPEMPKMPCNMIAVARRGGGKSVAISNLVRMMNFDRVFLISPTASSNHSILQPLGIADDDIYEDLDCPNILRKVIEKGEAERDEYVAYLEAKKRYDTLMRLLGKDKETIPDELLEEFYGEEDFVMPTYKHGNRMPKLALIIDDAQNSKVFSGKSLPSLCIKHRHQFQLPKAHGGNSIGLSVFLMAQNYKSMGGGLPKPVRGNATGFLLFKNHSKKEKEFVAEEISFDDDKEKFIQMWDDVCDESPHAFLFVDMNPKQHHPSPYRSNFNKFILMDK